MITTRSLADRVALWRLERAEMRASVLLREVAEQAPVDPVDDEHTLRDEMQEAGLL